MDVLAMLILLNHKHGTTFHLFMSSSVFFLSNSCSFHCTNLSLPWLNLFLSIFCFCFWYCECLYFFVRYFIFSASLTWWTWVWVNSGSWWWTGRPGVLWFMGSQKSRTQLSNWTELSLIDFYMLTLYSPILLKLLTISNSFMVKSLVFSAN